MFTSPSNIDEVLQNAHEAKQDMDRIILASGPPEISDNAIWVVDAKTGCHFRGKALRHSESCSCGDYPEN